MPFAVKDPAALDHSQTGQRIKATLVVTKTESWLEDLQVTAQAPADATAPLANCRFLSKARPFRTSSSPIKMANAYTSPNTRAK